MKFEKLEDGTFALIFDKGDEFIETLTAFAREKDFGGSHFTAIGAFRDVMLGYFDREKKKYRQIPIGEQVEVLSLVGDIALKDKIPQVHAHVVGRQSGRNRSWRTHSRSARMADIGSGFDGVAQTPAAKDGLRNRPRPD